MRSSSGVQARSARGIYSITLCQYCYILKQCLNSRGSVWRHFLPKYPIATTKYKECKPKGIVQPKRKVPLVYSPSLFKTCMKSFCPHNKRVIGVQNNIGPYCLVEIIILIITITKLKVTYFKISYFTLHRRKKVKPFLSIKKFVEFGVNSSFTAIK